MIKRFGLSRGVSPREYLKSVGESARLCEDNGFEVLWFIDHQLGMKDVYAAMNVSALNTSKIEIGSAVTNLVTRHPTVTANATTALDELSDGRALLGLGAGWIAVHSIGQDQSKWLNYGNGYPISDIFFQETSLSLMVQVFNWPRLAGKSPFSWPRHNRACWKFPESSVTAQF